jgi:hypothetical protein
MTQLGNFFDIENDSFDYQNERKTFIDNLDYLKSMTVEEQTLYKKWQEFNKDNNFHRFAYKFDILEKRIWTPTDINNLELTISEIEKINPVVEYVERGNSSEIENWVLVRKLIHTMEYVANPGRNLKFYVKDSNTGKILGLICMGSDVTSIGIRDEYIKWTKDNKFVDGKLRCTSIGTSIVATQPLGFNFLGGKLIAALVTSSTIRNKWEELYGDKLIGTTTTSLYGIHSMYNGMPHWKTLGESKGRVAIKPDDSVYKPWLNWMKTERNEDFKKISTQKEGVAGPPTGIKQRLLDYIFRDLGIKKKTYEHGFKRGVFFANMYENGLEFLRGEIDDSDLILKKKFVGDFEYTYRWWKKKAVRRYTKLYNEGRLKPEKLFYSKMLGMTWYQARKEYLSEVGR